MSKVFLTESNTAMYFDGISELSVIVQWQCNDGYIFINLFPELCFYHCHLLGPEWQLPGLTNSAVMYFHVEQHIVVISLIFLDEITLSEMRWHFAWHFGMPLLALGIGHTVFFLEEAVSTHSFYFQKSLEDTCFTKTLFNIHLWYMCQCWDATETVSIAYTCSLSYLCWMEIM